MTIISNLWRHPLTWGFAALILIHLALFAIAHFINP